MQFVADNTAESGFPEHLLACNQESSPENLALFKSALAGSMMGVETALAKGAKPDFFFRPEDQKNALHISSERGSAHIVTALLDAGANVNCVAISSKNTALILAAQFNHSEVVKILLERGADVNAVNGYGNTALHGVMQSEPGASGEETINLLLKHHCNANARNHKHSTPLHFLCYGSDREAYPLSLVEFMVKSGADIHAVDDAGRTPLLVCCSSGRDDLIDTLMSHGADPTVRDSLDQCAYDIAKFHHCDALVKRFGKESPSDRFAKKKEEATP